MRKSGGCRRVDRIRASALPRRSGCRRWTRGGRPRKSPSCRSGRDGRRILRLSTGRSGWRAARRRARWDGGTRGPSRYFRTKAEIPIALNQRRPDVPRDPWPARCSRRPARRRRPCRWRPGPRDKSSASAYRCRRLPARPGATLPQRDLHGLIVQRGRRGSSCRLGRWHLSSACGPPAKVVTKNPTIAIHFTASSCVRSCHILLQASTIDDTLGLQLEARQRLSGTTVTSIRSPRCSRNDSASAGATSFGASISNSISSIEWLISRTMRYSATGKARTMASTAGWIDVDTPHDHQVVETTQHAAGQQEECPAAGAAVAAGLHQVACPIADDRPARPPRLVRTARRAGRPQPVATVSGSTISAMNSASLTCSPRCASQEYA